MCLFNFLGCVGERAWQSSQRHYAPYISTFYCFSSLSKVVSLFVTSSLFCFCCCSACPSHFFFFLVVRASPFFFCYCVYFLPIPSLTSPSLLSSTSVFSVSQHCTYVCFFLFWYQTAHLFLLRHPTASNGSCVFYPFCFLSLCLLPSWLITLIAIYMCFFFFHGLTRDRLCYASSLPLRCGTEAKSIL